MGCLTCVGSHRHRQVHSICAFDPWHAAKEVAMKGEHPWRSLRERVAEGDRLLIGVARGDETGGRSTANHLSGLIEQPRRAPHADQDAELKRGSNKDPLQGKVLPQVPSVPLEPDRAWSAVRAYNTGCSHHKSSPPGPAALATATPSCCACFSCRMCAGSSLSLYIQVRDQPTLRHQSIRRIPRTPPLHSSSQPLPASLGS